MARTKTPFDKILAARNKLAMFVEYGEPALGGQSFKGFAEEVNEAFEYLMSFRNIINGMVSLEEPPDRAVLPYLSGDALQAAADSVTG
jgi:hypothetical protein